MNSKEKILALQLILEDIRGNWGWNLQERVDVALELATELSKEYPIYEQMIDTINEYKVDCSNGDNDGKFFREKFPYGYEGMNREHNLKRTYVDKSNEFKSLISCLTYPEQLFSDSKEE